MRATINNAATATKPKYRATISRQRALKILERYMAERVWDYSAPRASPLRGRPSGVIPLRFVT
jgi:hypothetical protein